MAKCDLAIELAKPGRSYRAGESVRGHVVVRTAEDVHCDGLKVEMRWRTHGSGNRDEGPATAQLLFQGDWNAGTQRSFPFEFTAPNGPATYHGELVSVEHYVSATAALPRALDPKSEIAFQLEPTPGADYCHGLTQFYGPQLLKAAGVVEALGAVFVVGCVGLPGLMMLFMGLVLAIGFEGTGLAPVLALTLMGGFLALVGIGNAVRLQKRRLAQARLGSPVVDVSPTSVRKGEHVTVAVTLEPRGAVTLTGVTAVLRGVERAVSGSGKSMKTHTKELHAARADLGAPPQLQPGQTAGLSAHFAIPADAPATFAASANNVMWLVEVTIALPGWPDWQRTFPVMVTP